MPSTPSPKASLNSEKLRILDLRGNVLVVANPGTGKTLLLAHKYARLVRDGVKPEDILCLTYTNKAEDEMRQAIGKALLEYGVKLDYSKVKVRNFHSYALEEIGEQERISNDLLRYAIYRHLSENRILNYEGDYLTSTIVPKIEDSIRYLKCFGVMPGDIDLRKVQRLLTDYKTQTKEEIDKYAGAYLEIFRKYESTKSGRGVDYADMLLEFMRMKVKPRFEHVLVDELQDVSDIEAEIALQSCKSFFVVGDRKQAIFAFQGGSILNFRKFAADASYRILSENFRSTNEILDYAKEIFSSKTKDTKAAEETRDLRNKEKGAGPRPKIYGVEREDIVPLACQLVSELRKKGLHVAVIARTNGRIWEVSKELGRRGIEHSSTAYEASSEAQEYILKFLLGVLSNQTNDVRNAMFTPFFPISLQNAFEL
jgi:DNA helicase-2/ATP-dependent DNA helicase PcrA